MSAQDTISPFAAIITGRWSSINGTASTATPIARLWDIKQREEFATFSNCSDANFSPDGRTILVVGEDSIRLYDFPLQRSWGLVVALTTLTWGVILLAFWYAIRRIRRWGCLPVNSSCGQQSQTGANSCRN
jgi:WD40 repeat protein